MMEKQHTIERPASVSGIALHTGARATLRILPAETDRGIIFRRVDLPGTPEVRALATNVVDARRGTTIACGNAVVYTVEHIMSALHVGGIDNAVVEMDGLEPPIADGSAMPYWEMVKAAGRVEQAAPAEFFHCREILHLKHGDTQMVMTPAEQLEISCLASFRGCPFDPQYQSFVISPETYEKEIEAHSVRIAEIMKEHEHGVLTTTSDKLLIDFVTKSTTRPDSKVLKAMYPTILPDVMNTTQSR